MYGKYREELKKELEEIAESGLYKSERHITSAQQARIRVDAKQVLNMCANNYLGLADNKEIIESVKKVPGTAGPLLRAVRGGYKREWQGWRWPIR